MIAVLVVLRNSSIEVASHQRAAGNTGGHTWQIVFGGR